LLDARSHDLTGEDFDRAYAVASYLHPCGDAATTIVLRAIAQLDSARGTQDKRAYYHARRDVDVTRPYKLQLAATHLLQRLVLEESRRFERTTEKDGSATGRDMLVRYVKELVLLSMGRNTFYGTLAVSRVLYDYSTREAMDLYANVHDDDSLKEPYYYRSRRQRVLEMLVERFGPRLQFVRASRGERRLVAVADEHAAAQVFEALEMFTPWRVVCEACSTNPAACSDHDEVSRLHKLFSPRCFSALTAALHMPPPAARLRVPRFNSCAEAVTTTA
jgi:hypothetical protein